MTVPVYSVRDFSTVLRSYLFPQKLNSFVPHRLQILHVGPQRSQTTQGGGSRKSWRSQGIQGECLCPVPYTGSKVPDYAPTSSVRSRTVQTNSDGKKTQRIQSMCWRREKGTLIDFQGWRVTHRHTLTSHTRAYVCTDVQPLLLYPYGHIPNTIPGYFTSTPVLISLFRRQFWLGTVGRIGWRLDDKLNDWNFPIERFYSVK